MTKEEMLEKRFEDIEQSLLSLGKAHNSLTYWVMEYAKKDSLHDDSVTEVLESHSRSIKDIRGAIKSKFSKTNLKDEEGSNTAYIGENLFDAFVNTDTIFRLRKLIENYAHKHEILIGNRPMMDVLGDVMIIDPMPFFEDLNEILYDGEEMPQYVREALIAIEDSKEQLKVEKELAEENDEDVEDVIVH